MTLVVILTGITAILGFLFLGLLGAAIASRRRHSRLADARAARRAQAYEITRLRCEVAELRATNLDLKVQMRTRSAIVTPDREVGGGAFSQLQETRKQIIKTLHPDSNSSRSKAERAVLEEAFKEIWPVLTSAPAAPRS